MNTLDLALRRTKLRKVSGTKGGEWQGPCPGCGGTDRFHVRPEDQNGKGGYGCRGCGKYGDNIQFLRDFEGMSFKEACAYLSIELPDRPGRTVRADTARPSFTPNVHADPEDIWRERAEKLVAWGQEQLAKKPDVLTWLAGRGILAEAVSKYRLGWNPGENGHAIFRHRKSWGLPEVLKEDGKTPKKLWIPIGLVVPYSRSGRVVRIQIRQPEGEPRYYNLPGSSMGTMMLGADRRAFVVVEAALDAIAVYENNQLAGAVATLSASAKPDSDAWPILQGSLQILDALDYDAAGAKYAAWWQENFDRCERWPVPKGKDPGEAYKLGIDLEQWIKAGMPPAITLDDRERHPEREPGDETEEENIGTNRPIGETKPPGDKTSAPDPDLPASVLELYKLLRQNHDVRIINTPERFAVVRGQDERPVGGRIGQLVMHDDAVLDYIAAHPAPEIDAKNFMRRN